MKRCTMTKHKITQHDLRRGEPTTTDAAANAMRVALFRPGYSAACKCSTGACSEQDCDELGIFDENNKHVFSAHGRDYRAANEPSTENKAGGLVVYKMPGATRDEDRLLQLRDALVELNRKNAEFWATPE